MLRLLRESVWEAYAAPFLRRDISGSRSVIHGYRRMQRRQFQFTNADNSQHYYSLDYFGNRRVRRNATHRYRYQLHQHQHCSMG
jgi:hypothetical protein